MSAYLRRSEAVTPRINAMMQVVVRPWHKDLALAVAQQIETALGGWQRPPL